MNITYEKCGDYLIPNVIPNLEPKRVKEIWADVKKYLKEYRGSIYQGMVLSGHSKCKNRCFGYRNF